MRIALVPYARDWSYDFTAKALAQHLPCETEIIYNDTLVDFVPSEFDLVVDFWWRGTFGRRCGERAVKQVSSHRWAHETYGNLDVPALIHGHLRRVGAVLVPSRRLEAEIAGAPHVALCPKGFHPETFGDAGDRRGDLVVGWAGKPNAPDKRVPIIVEACPDLRIASDLNYDQMPDWYNSIDVITCASTAEGDPRPLIEGMACGAFPVCVDVGIVPELVRHRDNGLIVERTPEAFAAAFAWCRANLDYVRAAGRRNAQEMLATRTWAQIVPAWDAALTAAVARAPEWRITAREERKARILAARKKRTAERLLCP